MGLTNITQWVILIIVGHGGVNVVNEEEIKAPAWVIDTIHHGVNYSSTAVKLIKRIKSDICELELSLLIH